IRMTAASRYVLCMEQTLGHRAHSANIAQAIEYRRIEADLLPIAPPAQPRLPLPWALRGSIGALAALPRPGQYGSILFHTQTVSLLAPLAARGTPYVVSLDATPRQVDEMGDGY